MLNQFYSRPESFITISHSRTESPQPADFHLHNFYEIYFFISGDVNYFIEKDFYALKYGDLIIMNSHEIHKPSFQSKAAYERIVIHFDPALARFFNASDCNLLHCFDSRPKGEQNKINLSSTQLDNLLSLFDKLVQLNECGTPGAKVLKLSYFLEVLVLINKAFAAGEDRDEHVIIPRRLVPVIEHIDANLHENLSLESLEKKFFINSSYLCRLFKKSTGSTIHEYILFKRISRAKKLLSEGCSVTECSMLCGFNDYSNFSRMFKRTVGISPGKYCKTH